MAAIITQNAPAARRPATAPARDGDPWRWEIVTGGQRVYADTLLDGLDALIPNHAATLADSAARAWAARVAHARIVRPSIQRHLIHAVGASLAEPDAHTAMSLVGGERLDFWDSPVPLVLIDADYRPHASAPAPLTPHGDLRQASNLVWLTTHDPEEYLQSLAAAGWLTLHRHRAHLP